MFNNIYRASSRIFNKFNTPILSTNTILFNRNLETSPIKILNIKSMATANTALAKTSNTKAIYRFTNRLADEKSPYLLQHAHNPVDWYPWGDEAINKAKTENKMIFLSVGYSTCHWCHVMEHESFENEEIAKIMNDNFINIKVDREERPDIDKIYMNIVTLTSGSGGWPMSVWLTPNLTPITAGTYFPPIDKWGVPGFQTVLKTIIHRWATNQDEIVSTGHRIIEGIKKHLLTKPKYDTFVPGSVDAKVNEAIDIFKQKFDPEYGGFGRHPKFPEVSRLNILFHAYIMTKDESVLNMALRTLTKIGAGGIHDHVFGGFARYSVDQKWHVPHFEKMLYDQGQLMGSYANAYKLTANEMFMDYADGIFRYIMKDLRHPLGGFYSGEDADSLPTANDKLKIEGAFYAWTEKEIQDAFSKNSDKFQLDTAKVYEIYAYHYDIQTSGNVEPSSDPHGHLVDKNILIVRKSFKDTCEHFNITSIEAKSLLTTANEILHEIRDERPRPHLDTKIITAWNGLVLSGIARLAGCGGPKESVYMQAAKDLLMFLKKYNYNPEKKTLLRSSYGTGTQDDKVTEILCDPIDGFLDDYAFLIKGLLDYYKSSLDAAALEWAKELQDTQNKLFWDVKNGGYFYSKENSANVIIRLKEDHDGAEPCGNSVSARNLILLSYYYDLDDYKTKSDKLFAYFADSEPFGYVFPKMLSALILHEHGLDLVAVVGPDSENTKKFVEICRKYYIPGMIIVHIDPDNPSDIRKRAQDKFKMVKGQPTVYICHDKVCRMPVTDPNLLEQNLKTNYFAHNLNE